MVIVVVGVRGKEVALEVTITRPCTPSRYYGIRGRIVKVGRGAMIPGEGAGGIQGRYRFLKAISADRDTEAC